MIDLKTFINSQLACWSLARENYAGLEEAVMKVFSFDGFEVFLQYNPRRIRSSIAQTDAQSIKERPCFLCHANRPKEQMQIVYKEKYEILVNPYPILNPHFTIVDRKHVPQEISKSRIDDMLDLAKDLPGYTVLFNGAQCGASAPDHFHFQAVKQGILPIEKDIEHIPAKKDYLRNYFLYKSIDKNEIKTLVDNKDQMVNIACWYKNNSWHLVVFPRKQHRPHQYYETGERQILISPGVIDFAGILIAVRKEDFDKIDKDTIEDIYTQLTLWRYHK